MKNGFSLALVVVATLWIPAPRAVSQAQEAQTAWDALASGGHIAIIRHALAPGTGDPAEFALDDCTTQRNLSEEGREQARRIGRAFERNSVTVARVLTSQWCRCRGTAELLGLAAVSDEPFLNSFFAQRQRGPVQTAALREFVTRSFSGPSIVLVTHQVNITGLTEVYPSSGEIVVLKPLGEAGFSVVARLKP